MFLFTYIQKDIPFWWDPKVEKWQLFWQFPCSCNNLTFMTQFQICWAQNHLETSKEMEPGGRSGILKFKDMVVAAEGVAAEGQHGSCHISQNVVDVVVMAQPEDPLDSFEIPNLSAWKKLEIDGKGADNVNVLLSPDKSLFYNDLTFEQVREFKLHSDDDKHGVISTSRMFYACLACTL